MKSKMHSEKRSYDQWCAVARSLDVVGGRCAVREGRTFSPDATFVTDAATLFRLRRRELTPRQAIASGKVRVDGDPKALERFVDAFAWSKERLARMSASA